MIRQCCKRGKIRFLVGASKEVRTHALSITHIFLTIRQTETADEITRFFPRAAAPRPGILRNEEPLISAFLLQRRDRCRTEIRGSSQAQNDGGGCWRSL